MTVVAYLAGLVTLPVVFTLWAFFGWARARSWGRGECSICDGRWAGRGYEIGDVSNLTHWARSNAHACLYARRPWHKQARGDEWREKDARRIIQRAWDSRYMQ